jgi:hypothetical protein
LFRAIRHLFLVRVLASLQATLFAQAAANTLVGELL